MKKRTISSGPINRSRREQRAYSTYRRQKPAERCDFCSFSAGLAHIVREYPTFWVVRNIFPYNIWDQSHVGQHLMIVPKRHVDTIAHFTAEELSDYAHILAEWEAKGFSFYARAAQNKHKSVVHQHTHLIEVGHAIRRQIYIEKPHINIVR